MWGNGYFKIILCKELLRKLVHIQASKELLFLEIKIRKSLMASCHVKLLWMMCQTLLDTSVMCPSVIHAIVWNYLVPQNIS